MTRGEVWWARLSPPRGHRPVVLLSRNHAYQVRRSVTVAPLTTRIRGLPVEVVLDAGDGVAQRCAINADDIITISMSELDRPITTLSTEKLQALRTAITYALALDEP